MLLSPRERKKLFFNIFRELISKHRYIIFIDSYRLKASMLEQVRRMQHRLGFIIKGGKKNVFIKALESLDPVAAKTLKDKLKGQILFIFTNKNPINISMELDKFEVDLPASPGDITPIDIIIPEGNTGIPPGPVISLFSNLGIPTKISGGAIYVVKATLVAKKGDRITANLANLLNKLDIKPIKSKVNIIFAYDLEENIFIPREYLIPDLDKLCSDLEAAFKAGFKLAYAIGIVNKYTATPLIIEAYQNAMKIGLETSLPLPGITEGLLIKAIRYAKVIQEKLNI